MHLLLPVGPCVPTGRYWLAGVAAAIAVVQIQEAPPIKWRVLPRAAKYWYQTLVPEATCECCDGKEGPFVPPRYYESCAKRCAPSPAPSPPPAPLSIGTVHLALGAQTLFAQGHTGTWHPPIRTCTCPDWRRALAVVVLALFTMPCFSAHLGPWNLPPGCCLAPYGSVSSTAMRRRGAGCCA